jgi:Phage integrase family
MAGSRVRGFAYWSWLLLVGPLVGDCLASDDTGSCATHNYERGVDLVAIQQLLGHWTVSSTMRYVRPSATFIEDAYRRAVTSTLAELSGEDGLA